METWSIATDGIADLAITDLALERRLGAATREQQDEIETRVNDELVKTGWDGDWSAESIIRDVLDR